MRPYTSPFKGWQFDVTPIQTIADKVHALYERLQPLETDPMMNFDERELLRWTEQAGFNEVHLELRADVAPCRPTQWDVDIRIAGNPTIPTLEEALNEALMPAEAEHVTAYMKPRVERGDGTSHQAVAYLWAVKKSGAQAASSDAARCGRRYGSRTARRTRAVRPQNRLQSRWRCCGK